MQFLSVVKQTQRLSQENQTLKMLNKLVRYNATQKYALHLITAT